MSCEKVILPSGMFMLGSKFGYIVTGKCFASDCSIPGNISSHTLFVLAINQSFPELCCLSNTSIVSKTSLDSLWALETIGTKDP